MITYLDALNTVLLYGEARQNRTGTKARSLFHLTLTFDLRKDFPAVTTKKLYFNQVKGELLGFIRGYTNVKDFQALGCTIWNENAEAPYWKKNPANQGDGDLGRIYGAQWRGWKTHTPILGEPTGTCPECGGLGKHDSASTRGGSWRQWSCATCDGSGKAGMQPIEGYRTLDQLQEVIERIQRDPYDRRLIVTAWNPGEIADMALPPCHVMHQYYVTPETGHLDLMMYQRSADMFLGVPFNIASYALLLSMVAQVTNLKPRRLIMVLGDAHIYHDHLDQVREQLRRKPLSKPTLWLNPECREIDSFEPNDIQLADYQCHPPLRGKMAV